MIPPTGRDNAANALRVVLTALFGGGSKSRFDFGIFFAVGDSVAKSLLDPKGADMRAPFVFAGTAAGGLISSSPRWKTPKPLKTSDFQYRPAGQIAFRPPSGPRAQ
jgi:hypothetical protein